MEYAGLLQTFRPLVVGWDLADGPRRFVSSVRSQVPLVKKVFIPLVFFFGLVIFLAIGLNRDPREIPSPLIGKPAPAFTLVTLDSDKTFSPEQMLGKVWMFNVWATWCVA